MHLLTATPGAVSNGDEAIDLGQTPGDIVVLTVADSELACLASAAATLGDAAPTIRLANLLQLRHPYSVDLYVEQVIDSAKFVCVILLGGKSYWPYGIDEIAKISRQKGIAFAAIADGREQDPDLVQASTVAPDICDRLRDYLRQGGVANAAAFLKTAARLGGRDAGDPDDPVPVADAGLYWPGTDRVTINQVRGQWREGQPTVLFLFYRALLIAGTLDAVDAMIAELQSHDLNVVPVYVRALREPFARDFLRASMLETPPDVILNATAFAASAPGEPRTPSVLEQADCPILQAVFASAEEQAWQASARGLGPRDLAMHIALPEVDGRLITRAVAFKAAARFDQRTECSIIVPQILPDRARFTAQLAANWGYLRKSKPADRRIALVLANYPSCAGRIGNGVGLDTPASAAAILRAMADGGYDIAGAPMDGASLMDLLTHDVAPASLPLTDYRAAFDALPASAREAVTARWGPPESDPSLRDAAFPLSIHRFGNVAVAVQPSRGYDVDPKSSYHDAALPPPHAYLAFHFWLARDFHAQAVVHVGKHGNLEWLPGKAIALSESCFPEICAGPVPQIYPFIVNDPGEGTQAKRRIGACIIDHLTPPLTRAESYGPLKELEALVDE